jgi:hypothetical protein
LCDKAENKNNNNDLIYKAHISITKKSRKEIDGLREAQPKVGLRKPRLHEAVLCEKGPVVSPNHLTKRKKSQGMPSRLRHKPGQHVMFERVSHADA